MTLEQVEMLGLAWLALAAAMLALVSVRFSRWSWGAAALLSAAWLAVNDSPGIAVALATGTLAGVVLEGPAVPVAADFGRLARNVALLVGALAGAVVILVRLAHVDASQAPYWFPVLGVGVIALTSLFGAAEPGEIHRPARMLLVGGAIEWALSGGAGGLAAGLVVAAGLPLLALTARLHRVADAPEPP